MSISTSAAPSSHQTHQASTNSLPNANPLLRFAPLSALALASCLGASCFPASALASVLGASAFAASALGASCFGSGGASTMLGGEGDGREERVRKGGREERRNAEAMRKKENKWRRSVEIERGIRVLDVNSKLKEEALERGRIKQMAGASYVIRPSTKKADKNRRSPLALSRLRDRGKATRGDAWVRARDRKQNQRTTTFFTQ